MEADEDSSRQRGAGAGAHHAGFARAVQRAAQGEAGAARLATVPVD